MAKLKWKWNKCRNSRFRGYTAAGIYDFYYHFGESKKYLICANIEVPSFRVTNYTLYEVHQKVYEPPTYEKELGVFNTSIKAKQFAENVERGN